MKWSGRVGHSHADGGAAWNRPRIHTYGEILRSACNNALCPSLSPTTFDVSWSAMACRSATRRLLPCLPVFACQRTIAKRSNLRSRCWWTVTIMYAMLGTRPDLAFAIGLLTRFNSNPGKSHVGALKRVLRYLKGSIEFQLTYGADSSGAVGPCLLSSATATQTGEAALTIVALCRVRCLPSQGEL